MPHQPIMFQKPFKAEGSQGFRQNLSELLANQQSGLTLQQPFYNSPEIYRLEVENLLMNRWHCVGHVSSIPKAGDYFLFEFDSESVIVVRGENGEVHAHANVCRHRGSRICSKQSGHANGGVLVCPYHAWVYKLDGSLRNARMMPPEFDSGSHGLKPVNVEVAEGLIFLNLSDEPREFSVVAEMLSATAGKFGWGDAKVIHEERYSIDANWKLALENQVECYHCGPSHPEFSRVHSQGRPNTEQITEQTRAARGEHGIDISPIDKWAERETRGEEAVFVERHGMFNNALTASDGGQPVAPLMGNASGYDGLFTIMYVGQLNHFLAYSDYGAIFRYTPRSVTQTDFHVTWLVRGDAKEGVDFDKEKVTWLWRITAAADKRIVEENQIGVNSRFYTPGPYADPIEAKTQRFIDWYLSEMSLAAQA
ncbi:MULTISPECIES: aromatic ring-hydroxylating oxygenase subunit alpha [Paraburkholderia]|uniref:Aromatic ring-hydroxylating dioxygenase subunit alpha n=1 Tax=Paraburkholderia podalyriae TaxID=1938811 RepID=A0ABR7PZF9_9BURK|nr:aromatic ring-hydroxylating dioxygenase subunit alpha [Paraburkholderia podalyriae]MBC8751676.1 aromatic ring-hydroxylating dioxygenase subunit alpha [Paraburkholderia podalyriae]